MNLLYRSTTTHVCSVFRMFVDALDAEMYEEHHITGHCYLSVNKVSLLLLLYVNFFHLIYIPVIITFWCYLLPLACQGVSRIQYDKK